MNELGVSEHTRLLAEELLNHGVMGLDLARELLGVLQRGERVCVGLAQELHAAGGGQVLERVDKLGHILLNLFQCGAADRESHLETLAVLGNHLEQRGAGGQVGAACNARDDVVVGKVVVVIVVVTDVKKPVILQPEGLVYLEIKTN